MMSIEGKVKALTESLEKQVKLFDRRRENNKKKAFLLKMLITSFGATTTILLGLQGIDGTSILSISTPVIVKNVALVLSALITLFSTWDAFFNHRELWIKYRSTTSQLKGIKSQLEYLSSNGSESLKEADVDRLYENYKSVIDQTEAFWVSLRESRSRDKS